MHAGAVVTARVVPGMHGQRSERLALPAHHADPVDRDQAVESLTREGSRPEGRRLADLCGSAVPGRAPGALQHPHSRAPVRRAEKVTASMSARIRKTFDPVSLLRFDGPHTLRLYTLAGRLSAHGPGTDGRRCSGTTAIASRAGCRFACRL